MEKLGAPAWPVQHPDLPSHDTWHPALRYNCLYTDLYMPSAWEGTMSRISITVSSVTNAVLIHTGHS